ncbi:hypothetical protein G7067_12310 [Leucobacter insecticola]|uniref:Uncharacterized protein n=1 Tax=Leucobacter insecticola TaxID=2714934 RepID=A0A6G8FKK7_9MICO|nr:hypothetical protein [Leucobacter insecticola]QIM17010.1 hypothetical protein G7067_12310 [Leucobacter insecticola]
MITFIILAGLLLTLGAVWAHVGFMGDRSIAVFEENGDQAGPGRFSVGTGYSDIAAPMHLGGYVVQGVGAALMLRVVFDTARVAWASRASTKTGPAETPAAQPGGASL